jgi:hypothetical protein
MCVLEAMTVPEEFGWKAEGEGEGGAGKGERGSRWTYIE